MRLFIACELPADVRKSLAGIASGFSSGSARMKWVEEENLHVTMKFLGDVPDGKVEKVKDALGVVAFGRFDARISGIGVFPPSGTPRVLWAGLEPTEGFSALHGAIEDALEGIGFERDGRRFSPHATLARVRSVDDLSSFRRSVSWIGMEGHGFSVESFILKSSVLTPSGPLYSDEAVFGARAER